MTSASFLEKSQAPSAPALASALRSRASLWHELTRGIGEQHAPVTEEWVYAGKNYGWSLRLKQKKRAVVYLTRAGLPREHRARRRRCAAHRGALPQPILRLIDRRQIRRRARRRDR
jgi:hypothetical protein